jgi:hypothetical protein
LAHIGFGLEIPGLNWISTPKIMRMVQMKIGYRKDTSEFSHVLQTLGCRYYKVQFIILQDPGYQAG